MKKINKGVSVIVCCYNSAGRLTETIKHIAMQNVPNYIPWELIVVDNASLDNTAETALKQWKKYDSATPFRVIHQPILGKKHALEKGMKTAKHECMLICDDDNWLHRDYVKIAYEVMEQHPEVAVLGGRGQAVFEVDAPAWFKEHEEHFGIGPQADNSGYVSSIRNWVYGAGFVIRKSSWEALMAAGFYSISTGPVGSRLSGGGEDLELCYAMKLAGYEIWYEDKLRFFHFMPKDRLKWTYFLRLTRTTAGLFFTLKPYQLLLNGSLKNTSSKIVIRIIILKLIYGNFKELCKSIVQRFIRLSFSFVGNQIDLKIIRSLTVIIICCFKFHKLEKNFSRILNFAISVNELSLTDGGQIHSSPHLYQRPFTGVL
jgi:glycosyltransferase involved in cell wall biosynthesis